MDFTHWLQIVVAVMIGNAFTASVLYFLIRLYRHEIMQGKKAETLSPWIFLCLLIPMAFAIGVYVTIPY